MALLLLPGALAYVDPGTGALLLQLLAAAALGVLVFARRQLVRIRSGIARLVGRQRDEDGDSSEG